MKYIFISLISDPCEDSMWPYTLAFTNFTGEAIAYSTP